MVINLLGWDLKLNSFSIYNINFSLVRHDGPLKNSSMVVLKRIDSHLKLRSSISFDC